MKRKFVPVLCAALAGLVMLSGPATVMAAPREDAVARSVIDTSPDLPYTKQYYYSQLSASSKMVYDAILASPLRYGPSTEVVAVDMTGLPESERTFVTTVTVSNPGIPGEGLLSEAECTAYCEGIVNAACGALIFDHPELSWLVNTEHGAGIWWKSPNGLNAGSLVPGETRILSDVPLLCTRLDFRMTDDAYAKATTDCSAVNSPDKYSYADTGDLRIIENRISQAMSEIGDLSMCASAEKVQAIHDWICAHMYYADKQGEKFLYNWRGYQTAFSGLLDGETVCAGYSEAFKLLCDAYDVPCVIVSGPDGTGGNHAWNYVQVDGSWYGVDCTWDDEYESPVYDFFLKGSSSFVGDPANSGHLEGILYASCSFRYPVLAAEDYPTGLGTVLENESVRIDALSAEPALPAMPGAEPSPATAPPESTMSPEQTPAAVTAATAIPTATATPAATASATAAHTATAAPVPASASAVPSPTAAWPPISPAADAQIDFAVLRGLAGEDDLIVGPVLRMPPQSVRSFTASVLVPDDTMFELVTADGRPAAPHAALATGQMAVLRSAVSNDVLWSGLLVVKGDVTGGGTLGLTQLVQMGKALSGKRILTSAEQMAADVTDDGRLTLTDLVQMAGSLAQMHSAVD